MDDKAEPQVRVTLHEMGHTFVDGDELGIRTLAGVYCCRSCGRVRPREGPKTDCPGRVRVELRENKP